MAPKTQSSTRWLHGSITLVHDGKKYYNALTGKPVELTPDQITALTPAPLTFKTSAPQAKPPTRPIRGVAARLLAEARA